MRVLHFLFQEKNNITSFLTNTLDAFGLLTMRKGVVDLAKWKPWAKTMYKVNPVKLQEGEFRIIQIYKVQEAPGKLRLP